MPNLLFGVCFDYEEIIMYSSFVIYLFFFIIGFYIPPSHANTLERSAGSRVWCLGPSRVFSFTSDRPFGIERQVCSLSTQPQVSTRLHYAITVCLPASVAAQELNLKYARATEQLNSGLFAPVAECLPRRPSFFLFFNNNPCTSTFICFNASLVAQHLH